MPRKTDDPRRSDAPRLQAGSTVPFSLRVDGPSWEAVQDECLRIAAVSRAYIPAASVVRALFERFAAELLGEHDEDRKKAASDFIWDLAEKRLGRRTSARAKDGERRQTLGEYLGLDTATLMNSPLLRSVTSTWDLSSTEGMPKVGEEPPPGCPPAPEYGASEARPHRQPATPTPSTSALPLEAPAPEAPDYDADDLVPTAYE